MSNTRSTRPSFERTTVVVGFAGVCWLLFNILNAFHIHHIHGWQSFGLALALTALLFVAGRVAARRLVASTELERRNSRLGGRAERRERARRYK